jgi:hypothetical protein
VTTDDSHYVRTVYLRSHFSSDSICGRLLLMVVMNSFSSRLDNENRCIFSDRNPEKYRPATYSMFDLVLKKVILFILT